MSELSNFVKTRRKKLGLSQDEFADKAGVALTVIRKIEQGKENLSLSKVNQVLQMFGHVLGPINENDDETRNS
ncbi:MAG: helix-turn-helix transcriptional regulator [Bacteroidales bacterium]|nr:helix-turn-helix transcriptional regulator [Bacteroidales bacterium]